MERFTLDKLPRKALRELEVESAFALASLVICAERLQVFRLLHKKTFTPAGAADRLGLEPTATERFFQALAAVGLLKRNGGRFTNSALTDKFFVKTRSIYWTRQYSRECYESYAEFMSLETKLKLTDALGRQPSSRRDGYVKLMEEDPERARDFTMMLYHLHQPEATRLAKALSLRGYYNLLDVGGGSGVMSIPLVRKNRRLNATILDVEPVCRVADGVISKARLSSRIRTLPGSFMKDLPSGFDVMMFCDVGTLGVNLLKRAYLRLPQGGLIVIVDSFLSNGDTTPLESVFHRLISPPSGLERRHELIDALRTTGFRRVRHTGLHLDVQLVTAVKP